VLRRSCLVGIALSYVPTLVVVAALAALFAWGGAFGTALTLLAAAAIGYVVVLLMFRAMGLQHRGVLVTREDQPELMAVVDDVMGRAQIMRLDGVWLEPSRIGHLPAAVSRMRASLRRSET